MACLRVLAVLFGVRLCGGCIEDSQTHEPPDLPPPLRPSELKSDSWDVCRMLGPAAQSEGISVTFVEPLQRFVMLYGGDVPAWLVIDEDGNVPAPLYQAPAPGAIHQRSARHPWGRATQSDPEQDAWSSPEPVLTRQQAAPYLACGDDPDELPGCTDSDEHSPLDLLATIAGLASDDPGDTLDIAADCIEGSAALAAQTAASGDSVGRLYGVSVIEEWTADVTDDVDGLADGERAAEVYWNVSTWNPYQVVLMKTQLRGNPRSKPEK